MLATTIQAYEEGALVYDPIEDWLEVDTLKYIKIERGLNGEAKRWKL